MTHAAATPSQKQSASATTAKVSAGDILVGLNAGADAKTPPAIIKLTPRGKVRTRDERAYDFEPETLAARFAADGIDLAVDMEHSLSAFMGDKKEGAVGWISKLEARVDGLYGHVEWLERGLKVLAARTHRYISPTFRHDEFGKATWLHSVALVAAPALANMPALAAAEIATADPKTPETKPMTTFARLAAKLGLNADASEDAMLEALTAKLNGSIDKGVHDATLAKLTATNDELTALKTTVRKQDVDAALEAALEAKKILPAEREHYEKLAASDEGFDQVKALLAAMTPKLAQTGLDGKTPPGSKDETADAGPVQLAAQAQAYQKEMADKGVTVSIADAVDHVMSKKG
ncbi:unnamed protein product [Effrenium voratum]|uniref:Uncharacterized protein n=1 Tax=Effrenium voratum TaxID=2562239 RepID=A0AA36IPV2_9DINO|nr:unnamed protein product [Effrenium voratum]